MRITACPSCGTSFSITEEQLSFDQGRVKCGQCGRFFNANEHIKQNYSEQEIKAVAEETIVEVYPNSPEDLGNHAPSHLSKTDTDHIFSFDLKESLDNNTVSNILHPKDYLTSHNRDLAKKAQEDFKNRKPNKKFLDLIEEIESTEKEPTQEKTETPEEKQLVDHFTKALAQTKKEQAIRDVFSSNKKHELEKGDKTQEKQTHKKIEKSEDLQSEEKVAPKETSTKKSSDDIELTNKKVCEGTTENIAPEKEEDKQDQQTVTKEKNEQPDLIEQRTPTQAEEALVSSTISDEPALTLETHNKQEKLSDHWAFGACVATLIILIGQLIFFPVFVAKNKAITTEGYSSSALIKDDQLQLNIETNPNLISNKPTLYITLLDNEQHIIANKALKAEEYQPYLKTRNTHLFIELPLKTQGLKQAQTLKVGWLK